MNRRDRLNHQPFIKRPKLVLKDNKKISFKKAMQMI